MTDNPFDRIRAEVAELLGYDLNALTLHQKTRLDLATTAKFNFDADVAKLRVGGNPDPARMAENAALMARLLPVATTDVSEPGSRAARERLRAKLTQRILAEETAHCEELGIESFEELEGIRARNAALEAENERLRAAALAAAAPPSEPQSVEQNSVPKKLSDAELRNEQAKIARDHGRHMQPSHRADPPEHYLKKANPWDPYAGGNRLDNDPGWMLCNRWGKVGAG